MHFEAIAAAIFASIEGYITPQYKTAIADREHLVAVIANALEKVA